MRRIPLNTIIEIAAAQQKYRVAYSASTMLAWSDQKEHDETCPRRTLWAKSKANKQVHNLTNGWSPTETPHVHSKASLGPVKMECPRRFLVVAGLFVCVFMAVPKSKSSICPCNGCRLCTCHARYDTRHTSAVFEAPWWASPLQKESAFRALRGRTRSRLVVSGGKLIAAAR
jgi:hypothetical protein